MTRKFYNTIHESGETLKQSRKKVNRQERIILTIFQRHQVLSPWGIVILLDANKQFGWPITSIRRALTNLTKAGYIIKTDKMRMGPRGKPEHLWRLK